MNLTGQYSFFDKERRVKYTSTPRLQTDQEVKLDDPSIETLKWFSNGYYTINDHSEGIQFNDLRFGTIPLDNGEDHYIFHFILKEKSDLSYEMLATNGGPPPGSEQEMMGDLIERIRGI